ncbi:MAG: choice-of-anchor J domain-containing protein [Candidatus Eisenbacteria bacterium]|nr:choice-of-anchor J domain-containing protein [Candidatus Eisenbacteria bacterium]
MKRAVTIIVLGLFLVVAGGAAASNITVNKPDHPRYCDYQTPQHDVQLRESCEGFEGAFPPAGWTLGTTNPSYTWFKDASSYEGSYAAKVGWQVGNPQDETLSFSHLINSAAGEDHLTFYTMGSPYWSSNANLTVEVNGAEMFDYSLENQGGTFVWEEYDIDLSAYNGQTVDITFRYAGDDGADHHLDYVCIGGGVTPPEVPENDLCDGAIPLPCGNVNVSGSTELANDDYSPGEYGNSCTGYSASGNDVVYSITLGAATVVDLYYTAANDGSFYIVTDCADPEGTCVIGADATFSGDTETISTTLDAGTYYLILDGYSGSGTFTLTGLIDCTVNTEETSWGAVKKMYR